MRFPDSGSAVLFVAGDLSGDAHAARVAERFSAKHPEVAVHALGGRRLGQAVRERGGVWIGDTTNCSGIGLTAVLWIYPRGKWLSFKMRRFVRRNRIDAAVLCDWGGFNCRQLEFFRGVGVPVLYYFPPRSWQRSGPRGLDFAPLVDRVATPFRWSAERLRGVGAQAEWVGHPMVEDFRSERDREALRAEFGVGPGETLVAMLPGSRVPEVAVLGPRLAATARLLAARRPVHVVVPVPEPLFARARDCFPDWCHVVSGRTSDALVASDVAVVKTGSATLEAAVLGTPQVAVYDFGWLTRIEWILLWMWKNIPFIAMPNIILQRRAVTELLGLNCRPEAIAAEVERLLDDPVAAAGMKQDYAEIRRELGADLSSSATERTAEMLEEMLGLGGES